jgi:hypothetical protein
MQPRDVDPTGDLDLGAMAAEVMVDPVAPDQIEAKTGNPLANMLAATLFDWVNSPTGRKQQRRAMRPHQGTKEMARRRRQIALGRIPADQIMGASA